MTASTHEKIYPMPGGLHDDANASTRDAADMGMVPNFDSFSPQLGKNPTVGSWIGLCSVAAINKTPPGYMNLRKKGTTGPAGKVRIPLFDAPDG